MTNSPVYDQQLAINTYWQGIGGETMPPGTSRAADRYVRADYYLSTLPTDVDARAAIAGVLSVQRNAAKPIGLAEPGTPDRALTLWTSVTDSTALRYYFLDTLSPGACWVDLDRLDFDGSAPARRLNLKGQPAMHGEVSTRFESAAPSSCLGAGTEG